jgi:hypothetical protein
MQNVNRSLDRPLIYSDWRDVVLNGGSIACERDFAFIQGIARRPRSFSDVSGREHCGRLREGIG